MEVGRFGESCRTTVIRLLPKRGIICTLNMAAEIDWSKFNARHQISDVEKNLLQEVATRFIKESVGSSDDWRLSLGKNRHFIHDLVAEGYLHNVAGKFYPTFPALSFVPSDLQSGCVGIIERVLETLKIGYKVFQHKRVVVADIQSTSLALPKPLTADEVRLGASFLRDFPLYASNVEGGGDIPVSGIWVSENVLDFESIAEAWDNEMKRRFPPPSANATVPQIETSEIPRKVFVVHGRDERLREGMFTFLRALGLDPIEWTEAIKLTGKASPHISEILNSAFKHAQAVIVLLTPDDEARLRSDLVRPDESTEERTLTGQARPNVLFEAGMAFASHENRTVLVEIGRVRPFSDVAGRHAVKMDNSFEKRQELAIKLETAGCHVNRDGTDWHKAGDLTPPGQNSASVTASRSASGITEPQGRSDPRSTSALESPRGYNEIERVLLADLISEMEDTLNAARMPRIADTYRRPSSEAWRNSRNRLNLPENLKSDLALAYRQIDDWCRVVDARVHPNYGSQALNTATSSLMARLPGLIDSLRKLQG